MTEVSIGAGRGTVELSAGILHLKWSPGQAINEEDARAAVSAVQQLSGNTRNPSQSGADTAESAAQGVHNVHTPNP